MLKQSERFVRDVIYETCAELIGNGLSIPEALKSVEVVANSLFGRNWKQSEDDDEKFDDDTLPTKKAVRNALKQIEAQSLSHEVTVLEEISQSGSGAIITHAFDSTTKKSVGKFHVSSSY